MSMSVVPRRYHPPANDPARMVRDPGIFETELSKRARVRQPTTRVLAAKNLDWHPAPAALLPRGEYLSNADIGQYKALLWEIVLHQSVGARLLAFRVRLRGQPDEPPDFETRDEARAWGRLEVTNRLNVGWNPYAPVVREEHSCAD